MMYDACMKNQTITTYYVNNELNPPSCLIMVIRRKHNSYSYWNYAAKKWYGDNDCKYMGKTEITEEEALRIVNDCEKKYQKQLDTH